MSHLDRLFLGVNTLFLFKYPLQHKHGLPSTPPASFKDLVCDHYSEAELLEDSSAIDFERAIAECQAFEERKKMEQIE